MTGTATTRCTSRGWGASDEVASTALRVGFADVLHLESADGILVGVLPDVRHAVESLGRAGVDRVHNGHLLAIQAHCGGVDSDPLPAAVVATQRENVVVRVA